MDLHSILQVFRVIELKLGPQLKDLISALGRLLIVVTPLYPNLASCIRRNSAGFPAPGIKSGHVKNGTKLGKLCKMVTQ